VTDRDPKPANTETGFRDLFVEVPHPWAGAAGYDRYGRWAAFEVVGVQQRMRWIPSGRFLMGSPKTELGRYPNEGQNEVILTRGYWLGETPVTQALWVVVMGENPSRFRGKRPDDLERPVEQVSWDDCQAMIGRLNAQVAGLAARLPSEAEWVRACRAGTTAATWVGELSGWEVAPELDAIAWYGGNSGATTHPVGRKTPNPYGLHDMLGNVYEWCADAWDQLAPYPDGSPDPVAPKQGSPRVCRGGAWSSHAQCVRAAYRLALERGDRYGYLGFRLAAPR
jgi:formylglycine-generating enzyme required for sulfatase activity